MAERDKLGVLAINEDGILGLVTSQTEWTGIALMSAPGLAWKATNPIVIGNIDVNSGNIRIRDFIKLTQLPNAIVIKIHGIKEEIDLNKSHLI